MLPIVHRYFYAFFQFSFLNSLSDNLLEKLPFKLFIICVQYLEVKKSFFFYILISINIFINSDILVIFINSDILIDKNSGVGISQIIFSLLMLSHMARYLGWLMLYLFHLFWTILVDRPGKCLFYKLSVISV